MFSLRLHILPMYSIFEACRFRFFSSALLPTRSRPKKVDVFFSRCSMFTGFARCPKSPRLSTPWFVGVELSKVPKTSAPWFVGVDSTCWRFWFCIFRAPRNRGPHCPEPLNNRMVIMIIIISIAESRVSESPAPLVELREVLFHSSRGK